MVVDAIIDTEASCCGGSAVVWPHEHGSWVWRGESALTTSSMIHIMTFLLSQLRLQQTQVVLITPTCLTNVDIKAACLHNNSGLNLP